MAFGHKSLFMGKPLLIMVLLNLILVMHTCGARQLGETEVQGKESTGLKEEAEAQDSNPQLGQQKGQTTHPSNSRVGPYHQRPLRFTIPGTSYGLIPPMLDVPETSYLIPPRFGQQKGQIVHLSNSRAESYHQRPLMFDVPGSSYFIPPMLDVPETSYLIPPQFGQQKGQIVHLSNSRAESYHQRPLMFNVPGSSYLIPPMLDVPGSSYLIPPARTASNSQPHSP